MIAQPAISSIQNWVIARGLAGGSETDLLTGFASNAVKPGFGSEMRQAVRVAMFFGMIGVTLFRLIFTPIFYVLIRRLAGGSVAAT